MSESTTALEKAQQTADTLSDGTGPMSQLFQQLSSEMCDPTISDKNKLEILEQLTKKYRITVNHLLTFPSFLKGEFHRRVKYSS